MRLVNEVSPLIPSPIVLTEVIWFYLKYILFFLGEDSILEHQYETGQRSESFDSFTDCLNGGDLVLPKRHFIFSWGRIYYSNPNLRLVNEVSPLIPSPIVSTEVIWFYLKDILFFPGGGFITRIPT